MSDNTILQAFLYLQIFTTGVVAALAGRYAYRHYVSEKQPPSAAPASPTEDMHFSPAVKERLEHAYQVQIEEVLKYAAEQLHHDLDASRVQINNLVNKLASEIVGGEMESYRQQLSRLRQEADAQMGTISTEVAKHREALKAQLAQEIAAEKQQLIKLIDTKLADAVNAFLLETLRHNVDLGSQSAYLEAMLEEHKAEFIRGVAGETQSTQ